MSQDRREHRRLNIRLPVEYRPNNKSASGAIRTVTENISTGGVYCEMDMLEGVTLPQVGSVWEVELIVPPGDGYYPYHGRATSMVEVIRWCDPSSSATVSRAEPPCHRRVGIAARFSEPLKLAF
ncbi:MAG: PilZ domain-containing protein [Phycisphaerales bacterium]|nr:PilZ domain-containing protein [Phycisphaerales bacterium]